MRKFRTTHILGAGVITPALTGVPQHAIARSVDAPGNVETSSLNAAPASSEATRAHLLEVLLSLSPAEKRAIAGDRIRNNMPRTRLAAETGNTFGIACQNQKAAKGGSAGHITLPQAHTRPPPPPPPPPPPNVK